MVYNFSLWLSCVVSLPLRLECDREVSPPGWDLGSPFAKPRTRCGEKQVTEVSTPKTKQLEELAEKLKKFKPTNVLNAALRWTPNFREFSNITGDYKLSTWTRTDRFRLAKAAGLKHIYAWWTMTPGQPSITLCGICGKRRIRRIFEPLFENFAKRWRKPSMKIYDTFHRRAIHLSARRGEIEKSSRVFE